MADKPGTGARADDPVSELADTLRYSGEEAVRLARRLLEADPMLDVRLAHALPGSERGSVTAFSARQCTRLLHVLDRISEGRRLVPLVLHLVRHPDARVRSKAVLFVSRRLGDPEWVRRFCAEKDARVRANAIEGLWNIDLPEVRRLLRDAVRDKSSRVAGNAAYGLLILKHPEGVRAVREMSDSADPARAAAAAWVMGRTGDLAWVPALERLARDCAANVKMAAVRSLVKLRRANMPPEGPISTTTGTHQRDRVA